LLKGAPQSPEPAATQTDPLGRENPSGTVFGFLQEAQSGNYRAAADYLQMSAAAAFRKARARRKLKVLMDRAFVGNMRQISTRQKATRSSGASTHRQLARCKRRSRRPRGTGPRNRPQRRQDRLFSSET